MTADHFEVFGYPFAVQTDSAAARDCALRIYGDYLAEPPGTAAAVFSVKRDGQR